MMRLYLTDEQATIVVNALRRQHSYFNDVFNTLMDEGNVKKAEEYQIEADKISDLLDIMTEDK